MESTGLAAHLSQRFGLTDLVEIGHGGMGVVYKAFDPALRRHVAVKQLSASAVGADTDDSGGRDAALARFNSEMQMVANTRHSAIVSIHSSGVTDAGSVYFVMDYVPGQTLSDAIRRRRERGEPFTVAETVALLRPIASALDYLHLRVKPPIVHRDVKPGNILVPEEHSTFEARSLLTDFGISLTPDETRMTTLDMMIGTEAYTAPELYPGRSHGADSSQHNQPTASSDNYALALIAFEMLTLNTLKDTMSTGQWRGERPMPRLSELTVAARDGGVRDELSSVFSKAFAEAPAYRHPTANAFIDSLSGADSAQATTRTHVPASGDRATRQYAPNSGPMPAQPNYGPPPPNYQQGPRRQQSSIGTVVVASLATLLVLLLVAAAAAWFLVLRPSWSDADAAIADAFPGIVSDRENGSGWKGLTCESREPSEGQDARIVCASDSASVVIADYGSRENRDSRVSLTDAEGLGNDECTIASAEIPGSERPTYALLPEGELEPFALLISSANAKSDRLELPTC